MGLPLHERGGLRDADSPGHLGPRVTIVAPPNHVTHDTGRVRRLTARMASSRGRAASPPIHSLLLGWSVGGAILRPPTWVQRRTRNNPHSEEPS